MHHLNILLFLGGIGFAEAAILIVILAIAGFFIWRALLKYLVSKGPKGINIAAIIMGVFQSPVLAMIILGVIFGIVAMREENALLSEQKGLSAEEHKEKMQYYVDSLLSMRMVRVQNWLSMPISLKNTRPL